MVPEAEGWIELYPWVHPELSMTDLEKFSHLWVISWFHRHGNQFAKPKVHPPRREGESTGVFACRSPHRFNPIGLSVFKIIRVEPPRIYVQGLDLVDGTPVLDIKPYVAFSDAHPEANGSWADEPAPSMEVTLSEEAELQVNANRKMAPEQLKSLIIKVLEADPRPVPYRKKGEQEQPYGDTYGFYLHDWNVVFRVEGRTTTVLRLEPR
jgi:tRNA-Thr(GGU) m(6)t(6)A37 methyltransferase TsaA